MFKLGNKRSKKKIFLPLSLLLVLILLAFAVSFKIYTSNYYATDSSIVTDIKWQVRDRVVSYNDADATVFLPTNQKDKAVIVFYPGGKVEFSAYGGLMYTLAAKGYICVIPRMPENLAFLKIEAVDEIRKNYADDITTVGDIDWYLAGHSLGGVAAARYLAEQAAAGNVSSGDGESAGAAENGKGGSEGSPEVGGFKGLILCASYPADDLSELGISLLSIRGSNDGVLNLNKYEKNKKFWPSHAEEKVIDGGIHSFFGCYGIQKGDGEPDITNVQQLETTAEMIDEWITGE